MDCRPSASRDERLGRADSGDPGWRLTGATAPVGCASPLTFQASSGEQKSARLPVGIAGPNNRGKRVDSVETFTRQLYRADDTKPNRLN